MDNCRMNRNTCHRPLCAGSQNICRRSGCPADSTDVYSHLEDHLPIAMGYVPVQKWSHPFDLCKALQMGTIFPELCKPFCGKGGAICR